MVRAGPAGAQRSARLTLERFEWVPATPTSVLLRVHARCWAPSPRIVDWPRLRAAGRLGDALELEPVGPGRALRAGPQGPVWMGAFAAPREVTSEPEASFYLGANGLAVLVLRGPVALELGSAAVDPAPHANARPPMGASRGSSRRDVAPQAWSPTAVLGRLALAGTGVRAIVTAATAAAVTAAGVWLTQGPRATSRTEHRPGPTLTLSAFSRPLTATAEGLAPSSPPLPSLVARARQGSLAVYGSLVASRPGLVLHNPNPEGAPLVLLVERSTGARLEVSLPTRPNHSTGWIQRAAVDLSRDPFRLDVALGRHVLVLWRGARVVERDPIGVGRSALTPTPPGVYYVTELLKQSDPNTLYGPYAFGLSAHSTVLNEFLGGDGRIGIHGTNEPSRVGTDVSHGCIRVRNDVIRRLAARVPLGTPVRIAP